MRSQQFACFQASRAQDGQLRHTIETITTDALPMGDVLIRVEWSALNYKDALAAAGHPGVAGELPHVPGIDAAGIVETSDDSRYRVGDRVLVTGYELGAPAWGGWSEFIRVPADWVVPLPSSLSTRDAMVMGTAGFTAAQCVHALQTHGLTPQAGPILVTGATGGVGSCAVRLASALGYDVHAVTGKSELAAPLQSLGAYEVHARDLLADDPQRPMLAAKWAGGIDTVGGSMLTALLKSTKIGGCVSACGLVGGDTLGLTVYPFILRGVTLAGVTSSSCPRSDRERIWNRLSTDWRIDLPEAWITEVTLAELPDAIDRIKHGRCTGRVIIPLAT